MTAPDRAGTGRTAADLAVRSEPQAVPVVEAGGVRVPALLVGSAAWCWRILIVAGAFLLLVMLMDKLSLLVLPFLAAIIVTALLHPLVALLRRRGVPRGPATLITLLVALALLGGIFYFVANRASAQYPQLVDSLSKLVDQSRHALTQGPFHFKANTVDNIGGTISAQLTQHRTQVLSGALSAGRTIADIVTAAVLFIFLTIFLLFDGERIWDWLVRLFPRRAEERVRGAGRRTWKTLTGYITGQFCVALFHGVVMGVSLGLLGVPLVAPLAVLVFIGSFVPIIGAIVFGGLAVLVTLVTVGVTKALILLVVLVITDQIEAHILQPLVVGRYVRLHPIAIAVTLAGGALLAGLPGAIFGVPIVACANAAVKFLAGREDAEGNTLEPRLELEPPPVAAR